MSTKVWPGAAILAALSIGCSEDTGGGTPGMGGGAGIGGTAGAGGTAGTGMGGGGTAGAGGTAGTGMGGGGTNGDTLPADNSQANIMTFLDAQSFTASDWLAETDMPREAGVGSPHGSVRVYMSGPLVAFKQKEPDTTVSPEVHGAMAVKEFYDDAGTVLGHAVALYMDPPAQWTYLCYGSEGRCAGDGEVVAKDMPLYGVGMGGNVSACRTCHQGSIYTELPP